METFGTDDIQRAVGQVSFFRGLDNFERGMVRSVEFGSPGRIHGEVSGSRPKPYAVVAKFELGNDGRPVSVEGHCSCPVGYNCKHTAAVLLAARYLSPDGNGPGNGAGREAVSGDVRQWLDRWSEAAAGKAAGPSAGPPARRREHLFYVIHSDAMRHVHIAPYRAYLRKDGTIGTNFREYHERTPSRTHKYLTAEDAAILGRLDFHGSGYPRRHDWPDGEELIGLVRGIVETGRARADDIRGAALSWSEPRRCELAWAVGESGEQLTETRTGGVILSMVEGVQQLEVYFGQYLPQLFIAGLTPVLIFGFVAFVDPPIALAFLVAALVTLFAPAAWHNLDSKNSEARHRTYSAFGAEFLDSIQGLATLKAFGQSRERAAMLRAKAHELFKGTMLVMGTSTLSRGITDAGIGIGAAVALGWGAYRVEAGQMDLTALLIVLMLGVEVFRPLRDLRVILHQGMVGLAAAKGIFHLLDAQPLVHDAHVTGDAEVALVPTVTFEDVTFFYPGGRQPAHAGLSFDVRAGERLGIVGPSGSGKTSVARLLLRFYDPRAGRVLIGGRDLRELKFDRIRGQIAVVNQDTYLFHGTVEDNLRMGKPDATEAELEAAARAVNAHEFITRLPQGYRTVVGERGVRLSGGQRQRIAIARALLRDAPILILDEALSAVDAESEAVIQEALERHCQVN